MNKTVADFPEIAAEWHPELNGDLKPSDVSPRSRRKVYWLCRSGHTYAASPDYRMCGKNCPIDAGKKRYGTPILTMRHMHSTPR